MIGSYCRSIIVVSSIATRTPCFGALRCCANDAVESPNDKNASPFPVKYLSLSTDDLFIQCRMDTYRASGPGGQHRNKTESAVRLKHLPTGIVSQACDDRSQHKNRALALQRLRQQIAAKVRNPVDLETYEPPAELLRILPKRGQEKSNQQIGPNHPDFPVGMQLLLDLLWAVGGSVSDAAKKLGLSTGAISKILTSDRLLLQAANDIRAQKGMKALS